MGRRVSRITIFMYAQSQNIGKPNNLSLWEQTKSKGQNKISKFSYGHLWLREDIYVLSSAGEYDRRVGVFPLMT